MHWHLIIRKTKQEKEKNNMSLKLRIDHKSDINHRLLVWNNKQHAINLNEMNSNIRIYKIKKNEVEEGWREKKKQNRREKRVVRQSTALSIWINIVISENGTWHQSILFGLKELIFKCTYPFHPPWPSHTYIHTLSPNLSL